MIAYGGAGSLQSGKFSGKMITVNALLDESALPWQPDRYAGQVKQHLGDEFDNNFRIWYTENALHDDGGKAEDELRLCRYLGTLHQALLDVSAWVEDGTPPPASTSYNIKDGQVFVPVTANERKGVQPVFELTANGGKKAVVKAGVEVELYAEIELPVGSGQLIEARLHTNKTQASGNLFIIECPLEFLNKEKTKAVARYSYAFDKPGIFFPVMKVKAQRDGNKEDYFTHVENLSRVRIEVK
jgi:hypothetical protein